MTPSSVDPATAYEALVHLRAVCVRLLQQGTPSANLEGDDGRWVVVPDELTPADYLRAAFQRLVNNDSPDSTSAGDLLAVLSDLEQTAEGVGDVSSCEVLSTQRSALEDLIGCNFNRHGRDPTGAL